jgi:hypothetical protein
MQKEAAPRRSRPSPLVVGAALAPIAAIGIVAAGYSHEHGGAQKAQTRLAAVQAEVAALPAAHVQSVPALAALGAERNARLASLDGALVNRFELYPALVAIARVLPSDVWLTSLNLTSPTPADKPPPPPPTTASGTTTRPAPLRRRLPQHRR